MPQCTEVRFASLLSGGCITAIVVNPLERKLAKRTSVQWGEIISVEASPLSLICHCHYQYADNFAWGAVTNYVYKIWLFLTTYPPPFTFPMV